MNHRGPRRRTAGKRIFSFFFSTRFAAALLAIVAAASIPGTLTPQGKTAAPATGLSPLMTFINTVLRSNDIYHSPWFLALSSMLFVSLVICLIRRIPTTGRISSPPSPSVQPTLSAAVRKINPSAILVEAEELMRGLFRRFHRETTGETTILYAERGMPRRLSSILVHGGAIVVIIGAALSFLTGFEGYVEIPEDRQIAAIAARDGSETRRIPFSVRLDDFSISFYDDGTPKEYRSDLSFIEKGAVTKKASVLVNEPATFGGLTFYQSGYGVIDEAVITIGDDTGQRSYRVQEGAIIHLDDNAAIEVSHIDKDAMGFGPAVALSATTGDDVSRLVLFQRIDELLKIHRDFIKTHRQFDPAVLAPYTVVLRSVSELPFTGLMVNRDRGAPVAAAGAIVFIAGLLATAISGKRRCWIRINRREDFSAVEIFHQGCNNRDLKNLEKQARERWGGP
ncbi:MAG: cytochrome c biogenesis protein ResB [Deltaproteobacteria bacterium]|nr:cytochrome c biogenesis protein ResB [Deltaproteobacteria bacterium]